MDRGLPIWKSIKVDHHIVQLYEKYIHISGLDPKDKDAGLDPADDFMFLWLQGQNSTLILRDPETKSDGYSKVVLYKNGVAYEDDWVAEPDAFELNCLI